MSAMATDIAPRSRTATGVAIALLSATAFALSGPIARSLLTLGWSPGLIVTIRIAIGALALAPFGIRAMRGRWHLLRRHAGVVVAYGLLGVAGAQFCYFSAVQHMQAGPALLIEYTAPAVVVLWMWLRHRHRPTRWTTVGMVIALAGLVLVLDLASAGFSALGAAWALAAMVGAAAYFIISADDRIELPPIALASAGLIVAGVALALLGAVGLLPMTAAAGPATYGELAVPAWVPLAVLGTITAALAYATGIVAARRVGPRLASFLGLSEVVAAVLWSWVLLGELPRPIQFAGGALILLGVVAVHAGERTTAAATAAP
jgi:drug/metabolite transporter (DMT)-like permease